MYVFNADGTMQQANPDAGDPHSSDSDGKGVWVTDGDRIKGKWVQVTADRASRKFTGRAEISYDVKVNVDTFTGTVTASSYDANDTLTEGPTSPAPLEGKRVTFPRRTLLHPFLSPSSRSELSALGSQRQYHRMCVRSRVTGVRPSFTLANS